MVMKDIRMLSMIGIFAGAAYACAFEADFIPVQKDGEIEGLELFNDKLIVKSTGNIGYTIAE